MYENRIRSLPAIIALTMGIIMGVVCYMNGLDYSNICLRTSVTIALFYFAGTMLRKTIVDIGADKIKNIIKKPEKGANIDLVADDRQEVQSHLNADMTKKKDFSGKMEN